MLKKVLFLIVWVPIIGSCQSGNVVVQSNLILDSVQLIEQNQLIHNYDYRFLSYYMDGRIGYAVGDSVFVIHSLDSPTVLLNYPIPKQEGILFTIQEFGSNYFCLNQEGKLYQLIQDASPILIVDFSVHPELIKLGLMVDNWLSEQTTFYFLNDSIMVLPVKWNFYNLKGKYSNLKKPCPLFVKYNMQSEKIEICNVWSESFYEGAGFVGKQRTASRLIGDGLMIIHNPYISKVRLYDFHQDKIVREMDLKSSFQKTDILPLDKKLLKDSRIKDRYNIETAFYGQIVYNQYRKEYYRVFYHALPTKNDKNEYTIYTDKKSSILVYDETFHLKQEVLFEKEHYVFMGIFSTKSGMIFGERTSENKEGVFIESLNFEKN